MYKKTKSQSLYYHNISVIFFTIVFFIFKLTPSRVVNQPSSATPNQSLPPTSYQSPSPTSQLNVKSTTSQPAIVESKVRWLNPPQEVSVTSLEVKPMVNLFDLSSEDSLRILKVGSFSNGKYQAMSLYNMYYDRGMMDTPVVRFAYDKQKNNFVIFANSSCDLLSPFDDWGENVDGVKEFLHPEDVDQSKFPNNIQIEWGTIKGIPDRSFCGKSIEVSIRGQSLLIHDGPQAPKLEINHKNIIGESTFFPGVKIYKRFVSEKPMLADYEDIYYGISNDGSYYDVNQIINFDSLKYSKHPLARNGDILTNDVNNYGPFRIINEKFTKDKPQDAYETINSNLNNLEIDQNSIEQVATDLDGNIFYAIKSGSVLANSFYKALGPVTDESGQTIPQNEYLQCFPILIAKNKLDDMQIYYSGYAFAEIPEDGGRVLYTPNIFQVQ